MTRLLLLLPLSLIFTSFALADYQVPDSATNPKTSIKIGTAEYPADADDASSAFQKAIDDVNAGGGGRV